MQCGVLCLYRKDPLKLLSEVQAKKLLLPGWQGEMAQAFASKCPGAQCVRVPLPATRFRSAFLVSGLSGVCKEATFEFPEIMAPRLEAVGCLWVSLENLGQSVKCDARAALRPGVGVC